MPAETLHRIMERWDLDRRDATAIVVFGYGHPEHSPSQLVAQFVRGEGPAAVARGVAGVRRVPRFPSPVPWDTRQEVAA